MATPAPRRQDEKSTAAIVPAMRIEQQNHARHLAHARISLALEMARRKKTRIRPLRNNTIIPPKMQALHNQPPTLKFIFVEIRIGIADLFFK
jgi:hypothetical protein